MATTAPTTGSGPAGGKATADTARVPVEQLLHLAQERPDEQWLFQPIGGKDTVYTWREAADQVRRMASALHAMGLPAGSRVAISGQNTAHWLMADLATAMAGHVGVGLYPKQAPAAVTYILDHSEAKAAFIGPMPDIGDFMGAVPEGVKTIAFPYEGVPACDVRWDALVAQHEPLAEYSAPAPEDVFTLIYTSGSTGNPKGVMVTYANLMFAIDGFLQALPPAGHERLLSYLPLAHVFERAVVALGSLYYRAEVHFVENVQDLAKELARVAPTRFYGVPLVYGRLQKGILEKVPQSRLDLVNAVPVLRGLFRRRVLQAVGLRNAQVLISGSAPLPLPVLEWFHKNLGVEICQGYSMTENMLYATSNLPGQNKIGTVGRPLPGCELRLSDEDEILIRHPAVMKGYFKDPERTKEALTPDGWLRTGDKGRVDDEGYLTITGRVKEIFKTLKGKYVAPAPIEGAMAGNPHIDQLCLVGSGLNQPLMLVTLTPEARAKSRDDVERSLLDDVESVNRSLEPHEKIGKLVVVDDNWTIDSGFMTPTMKVRRDKVEDHYADLITREAAQRNQIAWA